MPTGTEISKFFNPFFHFCSIIFFRDCTYKSKMMYDSVQFPCTTFSNWNVQRCKIYYHEWHRSIWWEIHKRQRTASKDLVRLLSSVLTNTIVNASARKVNFKLCQHSSITCVRDVPVLQPWEYRSSF